jgi:hypothetical protein
MPTRDDPPRSAAEPELALSFVRDDFPFRVFREIGLVPTTGLGVVRRAVFFTLLAWLPLAIWAWVAKRALPSAPGEPLLQHFGVLVRCLVAIPLLILAQAFAHKTTTRLIPRFEKSGVVPERKRSDFEGVVRGVHRLRNATLPWVLILGLVVAWTAIGPVAREGEELNWAIDSASGQPRFGFGGWWFLYVARPIYITLVLAWLWRLALLTILFRRTAKLGLDLVPTHPDRTGGLGFIERFATMFAPVAFVLSAVLASHWAHQVVYHDLAVQSLKVPAGVFMVLTLVLFLAPLFAFAGPLAAAKKRAELEYGALVGRHGDLVRKRWILKEPVADAALLEAPEIGPVADTISLFQAVKAMRPMPVGKPSLLAIGLPALVPILVVFAIKVPLREVLTKLLHAVA